MCLAALRRGAKMPDRDKQTARANRTLIAAERRAIRPILASLRIMARGLRAEYLKGANKNFEKPIQEFEGRLREILRREMNRVVLLSAERVFSAMHGRKSTQPLEQKGFREIFESVISLWIDSQSLEKAKSVAASQREEVRKTIAAAQTEGLGEEETARRIQTTVGGKFARFRAARIARTEMHTASERGALEAANSTGVPMLKEWASSEDARTRESHFEADGQQRRMDVPFDVGGWSLMHPGDPAGPAHEVINCRCTVLYVPQI